MDSWHCATSSEYYFFIFIYFYLFLFLFIFRFWKNEWHTQCNASNIKAQMLYSANTKNNTLVHAMFYLFAPNAQ